MTVGRPVRANLCEKASLLVLQTKSKTPPNTHGSSQAQSEFWLILPI